MRTYKLETLCFGVRIGISVTESNPDRRWCHAPRWLLYIIAGAVMWGALGMAHAIVNLSDFLIPAITFVEALFCLHVLVGMLLSSGYNVARIVYQWAASRLATVGFISQFLARTTFTVSDVSNSSERQPSPSLKALDNVEFSDAVSFSASGYSMIHSSGLLIPSAHSCYNPEDQQEVGDGLSY